MNTREAFLALTLLPRVGPVTIRRLLDRFSDPRDVFKATARELQGVQGIGPALAKTIHAWESQIDLAREKRRIRDVGAHFLTIQEDAYPALLKEIHDPPPGIYVLGEIQERDASSIAVVGSRRSTHYGNTCARKLSADLARARFTIVSGLARGIDTAAHEGALEANGRTLAVIGCGLGTIYPPENQALAQRIAAGHGAVISEFPIDQIPDKTTFPMRNRIVSGLSRGLLVVECPAWSGAIITANLAGEHGRNVYAVPGPIDRPSSEGCHKLLKDGAKLVTLADDIIEDFTWLLPPSATDRQVHTGTSSPPSAATMDAEEWRIYQAIDATESHIDSLISQTGLSSSQVSICLLKMEIKRLVKQLPGQYYTRS